MIFMEHLHEGYDIISDMPIPSEVMQNDEKNIGQDIITHYRTLVKTLSAHISQLEQAVIVLEKEKSNIYRNLIMTPESLKEFRKRKLLSQKQLAENAGVATSVITVYESKNIGSKETYLAIYEYYKKFIHEEL